MIKFCADTSHLDIECSILDIHHLFCQTPTIPPAAGSVESNNTNQPPDLGAAGRHGA